MQTVVHLGLWLIGFRQAKTQTTAAEREALARHAAGRARIVEIGVWHGVSTLVLRRAMAEDGLLWAVDPFPPGRLGFSVPSFIAHREVRKASRGRVSWVRQTGVDAASTYVRSGLSGPDLVFIDGDHSYSTVLAEWNAWSPLLVPDGVICLHDSCSTAQRPIDAGSVAVTRDVVLKDPRFSLDEVVDSLTVVRRRAAPTV